MEEIPGDFLAMAHSCTDLRQLGCALILVAGERLKGITWFLEFENIGNIVFVWGVVSGCIKAYGPSNSRRWAVGSSKYLGADTFLFGFWRGLFSEVVSSSMGLLLLFCGEQSLWLCSASDERRMEQVGKESCKSHGRWSDKAPLPWRWEDGLWP